MSGSSDEEIVNEEEDAWDRETVNGEETFGHMRTSRTSLTSKILVEDLLLADKELLTLFYVVATWQSVHACRFANMNKLPEFSQKYWRQLDMNKVVHRYYALIDNLGEHCGDCTAMACSCNRCISECHYLEVIHLQRRAHVENITTLTLTAMLLSRDEERISTENKIQLEFYSTDEAGMKYRKEHFSEWHDALRQKYPGEYYISLKRHIEHWKTLSFDQQESFMARVRQIREWCDNLPDCPGVPWWGPHKKD